MRGALVMLALLAAPGLARGDAPSDGGSGGDAPRETSVENRFNMRVGGSTGDANGRPVVCAEVTVYWDVSVEGCGTGSGILHDDGGGEMAHFRLNKGLFLTRAGRGSFRVAGGIGFAELEVGDDAPGFDFGAPGGIEGASVAGAETALSARYLAPLGVGFEFIANASVGVAWFQGARELAVPQDRLQPFASLEIGVGW